MIVKDTSKVKIEYEGFLDSGEVFDTSRGRAPLEFVIGKNQVILSLEKGIMGMKKGEEKEIKIEAKDAYGEKNPDFFGKIPKEKLPIDSRDKVEAGSILIMKLPEGHEVPVKILEVDENEVTLDLNHPLAGENLNFKVKIVDVE
ncbi:MAG: FKBP-type peptidyl-prolyl cis-trans isomerase [Nanoarchaeota archaeon]|nr:FKBP-type peptidyl-prolyl cis-trans isomerase [Nanoarchaeota archaeon]